MISILAFYQNANIEAKSYKNGIKILYTSVDNQKSKLVEFDYGGEVLEEYDFEGSNCNLANYDYDKNLYIPSQFSDEIFILDKGVDKIKKIKTKIHPIFIEFYEDYLLTLHNTKFNETLLNLNYKGQDKSLKKEKNINLKGISLRAKVFDEKIYLRTDYYNEDKKAFEQFFNIIDLKSLEIIKKIKLKDSSKCEVIKKIGDYLYVGSSSILKGFNLMRYNIKKDDISYLNLKTYNEEYDTSINIFEYKDKIYVVNLSGTINILSKDFKEIKTLNLNKYIFSSLVKEDSIYFMEEDNKKIKISEYNLKDLKKINEFDVKKFDKMLPQNIY
ncbi:hypothetical protein WG909_03995 [Peptostreptococcaceae bacterium AGR-M142]